ncbi:hypothetical protein Tco_0331946 [Tanacetum coccineum]
MSSPNSYRPGNLRTCKLDNAAAVPIKSVSDSATFQEEGLNNTKKRSATSFNNSSSSLLCCHSNIIAATHPFAAISQTSATSCVEASSGLRYICRRISMVGLSSRTVPHLADVIHAAVTTIV